MYYDQKGRGWVDEEYTVPKNDLIVDKLVKGLWEGPMGNLLYETSGQAARDAETKGKQAIETKYDKALGDIDKLFGEAKGYQKDTQAKLLAIEEPWMKAGLEALNELRSRQGFSYKDFGFTFNPEEDPSYKFRLEQGLKSIQNSAAAKGLGLSGSQLKEASNYASGLASQEYNKAFARALQTYQTNLNKNLEEYKNLLGIAGLGAGARGEYMQGYMGANNNLSKISMGEGSTKAGINTAYGNALANLYERKRIGTDVAADTTLKAAQLGLDTIKTGADIGGGIAGVATGAA